MNRALLALCLLAPAIAVAETRRVAVVVGNNTGNAGQQPLRFAEVDASKVGRVLVELGGVEASDLFLVQGKRLPVLQGVLAKAASAISAYQRKGDRVVAIFYYSGHSDGIALELDRDRFTFAALREWLKSTGAEVRLALVDSCKSGALVAAKGGSFGPAFSIRLTDEVSASGEALLTSSASDENALESTEIGGSFFTHHLVSGLRGAADTSADGRVTLSEAYQYAYKHTISTSGATLAGPQHPTYDYRITGQGELVLTELSRPTAAVTVPDGFERALVIESARDQVIAELGRGEKAQIALSPGTYRVRVWKAGKVMEARVAIASGQHRSVAWQEMREVKLETSTAKGRTRETIDLAFELSGGARRSVADQLDALGGGRLGVRIGRFWIAVDASSRSLGMLRETSTFLVGGYRVAELGRGPFHASIGAELGGGLVVQTLPSTTASGVGLVAPLAEVSVDISRSIAIALAVQPAGTVLDADGSIGIAFLPSAWLGVVFRP